VILTVVCHLCCCMFHFSVYLADEDIEIELVEEEPPFLKGHGRSGMDLSPIRIVKVLYWSHLVIAYLCLSDNFYASLQCCTVLHLLLISRYVLRNFNFSKFYFIFYWENLAYFMSCSDTFHFADVAFVVILCWPHPVTKPNNKLKITTVKSTLKIL